MVQLLARPGTKGPGAASRERPRTVEHSSAVLGQVVLIKEHRCMEVSDAVLEGRSEQGGLAAEVGVDGLFIGLGR